MGRWSTGAMTVGGCTPIHIAAFAKHIKKGNINMQGSMKWSSGSSIHVVLLLTNGTYIVILN